MRPAEAQFYIAPRRCQFHAASAARKELGVDLVFKNPKWGGSAKVVTGAVVALPPSLGFLPRQSPHNNDDVVIPDSHAHEASLPAQQSMLEARHQ
ncbi:MAG: hypothetical protein WCA20_26280 [Candidatus Sulfotelmatobacter sp.]